MGIAEHFQVWILSVAGKCVLCQIICSHTEEINQWCKPVTDNGCCRCFYHDTQFYILRIGNAQFLKLRLYFLADFLNLLDFGNTGNHREHNTEISICRGPVQCPKLGFEYLRTGKADTDGTIAKRRIFLFAEFKIIGLLVRPDIQCTDDNLLFRHAFKHLTVCLELFFLGRVIGFSKIQEFTPEQPDSAGIV